VLGYAQRQADAVGVGGIADVYGAGVDGFDPHFLVGYTVRADHFQAVLTCESGNVVHRDDIKVDYDSLYVVFLHGATEFLECARYAHVAGPAAENGGERLCVLRVGLNDHYIQLRHRDLTFVHFQRRLPGPSVLKSRTV
jgi:hypothetical protein